MGNDGKTQPFKSPAADGGVTVGDTVSAGPTIPESIGPYRLIERLGEGGMGVVYKAEQRKPIQRIVAVKLIKLGFDSTEVLARFESERQALARMDHPNIAKVLDAGTDDRGRPYFVMEYVPGSPVTKYADENRLTIQQRLELMLQVCDAIGHAHAKAIIHRDIKAGNVLAYTTPEGPRVKVIDFGVAKALTLDRLTDRTFNTARGHAIGTYESMSPEQADGSPDIDTRADVYSLGVLLYELLSGTKPFDKTDLAKAAEEEIKRIIREVDPPKPSTQLSSLGDSATKIAKDRQVDVDALTRQLKSELDWIPLMALRKERERRYATPQQMAQDIRNYIEGSPLFAVQNSSAYRFRKFVRRNRAPIAVAACLIAVLLVGIAGTTYGLIRETRAEANEAKQRKIAESRGAEAIAQRKVADEQRAEAERQRATALAVSTFQKNMLAWPDPEVGGSSGDKVTVVQIMESAIKMLDGGSFANQPLIEAELRETIGMTLQSLGRYQEAQKQHQRALDLRRQFLPSGKVEILHSLAGVASALMDQNKASVAEPLLREALEIARTTFPPGASEIADAMNNLALMLKDAGQYEEAEKLFREALQIHRTSCPAGAPAIATSLNNLSELLVAQRKFDQAEPLAREALEIDRRASPTPSSKVAADLGGLGGIMKAQHNLVEAESLFREAVDICRKGLPAGHPNTAIELTKLADLLRARGKLDEAEPLFIEALQIRRKVLPAGHPLIAVTLDKYGLLLEAQGKFEQAESSFKEALQIRRGGLPPDDIQIADSLYDLAALYYSRGRIADAQPLVIEALKIRRKSLSPGDPDTLATLNNLAVIFQKQGKFHQAEPLLREALQLRRKYAPTDALTLAQALDNLAFVLRAERQLDEAAALYGEQVQIERKALPADDPRFTVALQHLASDLFAQGKFKEAEAPLREVLEICRKAHPGDSPELANMLNNLAVALMQQGEYSQAEPFLRDSVEVYTRTLGAKNKETAQTASALAALLDLTDRSAESKSVREAHGIPEPVAATTTLPVGAK